MSPSSPEAAQACVVNIGPKQRRLRLTFGLVCLGVAAALALGLLLGGAPRAVRAAVALPLLLAGYGVFQARART